MNTIAVTGGSGKLGSIVVKRLEQEGYSVLSIDQRLSDRLSCRQIIADLTDIGQVIGALQPADAILHLAAIPAPLLHPPAYIFANNVLSGYNILEAARLLGIRQVVLGSSESSYGFAWARSSFSPDYVPLNEHHPQKPQECYGLSKVVNEASAAAFNRHGEINILSLRFSTVMTASEYAAIVPEQPERFKKTLWSYIDIRDAADACLAALRYEDRAAECFNITANDTLSTWPTEQLLERFYPEVIRQFAFSGREALVSNSLAKRILSWHPRYSWIDER
ncbi:MULTISPECIES: NAD-dependent epimerase/dehydratase family protein [unclassified Paenibacillus]|uniref:NAD-dependent epimerase/dehydratase family protein n=1 Tax=unclassified Paenibacillus TaxID=185978 RepID=UPI0008392BC9|nr:MULTISPECIES: NAD(P)-dependent oxidoreductase [unclassified Paenibacillus]NWL89385.1 NAD(P)-dependent oxidoreductase [Paenibacillus sp. 79R4]